MNQPAPAWQPAPPAPDGAAPADAPAGPPLSMAAPAPPPLAAPPAPAAGGAPAPAGFTLPADPASALDVAAPLAAVPAPTTASAPATTASAPATPASAPAAPAPDSPAPMQSLAMPQYEPVQALPELGAAQQVNEGPAPIGGVAAASPDDLAELRDLRPAAAAAPRRAAAPDADRLLLPGNFIVLGLLGLTWQLLALYSGFVLPERTAAGVTLDNFDSLFNALPLIGSWPVAGFVGVLFGLGAIVLVWAGVKRGIREPLLQGVGALLGVLPIALLGLAGTLFPGA